MRVAAILVMLTGCDRLWNLDPIALPPDAPDINDAVGMAVDASPCVGGTAYGMNGPNGEGLLSICVTGTVPAGAALISPFNTGIAGNCSFYATTDTVGTKACVIIARTIMVSSDLNTNGPYPLVLVATDTLLVDAKLDVSAHLNGSRGSGSNWDHCGVSNGLASTYGGSGAAGGSDGTRGGAGGSAKVKYGAQAYQAFSLLLLHGGCAGGSGGTGNAEVAGGFGGDGGGAVYLIAGQTITLGIAAIINASGSGGHGGAAALASSSGGGGGGGGAGGSGGLIGLDAPSIVMMPGAKLCANGGGGGAAGAPGANGMAGADPNENIVTAPALGAPTTVSQMPGGAGGNGYARGMPATNGSQGQSGGGGGGGGGVVAVFSRSAQLSNEISPGAFQP